MSIDLVLVATSAHNCGVVLNHMTSRISQAPWFTWNPTTVAKLVALLHSLDHHSQFESLIFDANSRLQPHQCDLVLFYGKLIDSQSKQNSHIAFNVTFGYLYNLVRTSSSLHVKRMTYQYMLLVDIWVRVASEISEGGLVRAGGG
ncbi:hypothetical protein JHK87_002248 [Glycine soja]|nr:hypothetical protein JHK87_002248 [Glycine soja]